MDGAAALASISAHRRHRPHSQPADRSPAAAQAACGVDVDLLNNVEGIGLQRSRKIVAGLNAAAGEVDGELA